MTRQGVSSSVFGTFEKEVVEALKSVIFSDLYYMEMKDANDIKLFVVSSTGYTLPPGMYEIRRLNLM